MFNRNLVFADAMHHGNILHTKQVFISTICQN